MGKLIPAHSMHTSGVIRGPRHRGSTVSWLSCQRPLTRDTSVAAAQSVAG